MIDIKSTGSNTANMTISAHITYEMIFNFLAKKGYEVRSWLWQYFDETFPGGVTLQEHWTFTATKPGEKQSEANIFIKVFEKEFADDFYGMPFFVNT